MISRLKAAALLSGFRGAKPVDLTALSEIIMRVSEMAVDLKDEIEAIDVNPLICSGNSIVAVDALIAKRQMERSC
jgi:succinyl-CoA synthetase beta subunit